MAMIVMSFMAGAVFGFQSDPHDPAPWTCSPTSKEHECHCHRMDDDPMCEGTVFHEDSQCARYCEPAKCTCPVHCGS